MKREFIRLPEFERRWRDIGLVEDHIADLESALCSNPQKGDIMKGTGGLRKLRWRLRGNSGCIRVVYVDFAAYEKTYLISVSKKKKIIYQIESAMKSKKLSNSLRRN